MNACGGDAPRPSYRHCAKTRRVQATGAPVHQGDANPVLRQTIVEKDVSPDEHAANPQLAILHSNEVLHWLAQKVATTPILQPETVLPYVMPPMLPLSHVENPVPATDTSAGEMPNIALRGAAVAGVKAVPVRTALPRAARLTGQRGHAPVPGAATILLPLPSFLFRSHVQEPAHKSHRCPDYPDTGAGAQSSHHYRAGFPILPVFAPTL